MRTSPPRDRCRPTGPEADCTADTAGGLTFDVELPGGERWDAALLLRPGAGTGPGGEADDGGHNGDERLHGAASAPVRLPLFPSGAGRLRAALPSTVSLAEGRWAAFLALGEEPPRRLRSGHHDLRSLADREPGSHRTWLGVRVPYATEQNGLSLRSWLRWPHAEVRDLDLTDAAIVLRGRLYGAEPGPSARIEARPRHEGPAQDRAPTAAAASAPVTRDGGDFRCALPFASLPSDGDWDLWLRTSSTAQPVRVARILDDVAEKDRAAPAVSAAFCRPLRLPSVTATPYWTGANDLGLRLERAPGGGDLTSRSPGGASSRTETVRKE
jgi:hypothetical protein